MRGMSRPEPLPPPAARPRAAPSITVEPLLLVAALFWTLAANGRFFTAALHGRSPGDPATWGFAAALALGIVALHLLLLALVANRWTVKPLLAAMTVVTAFATYYMQVYGVYLDPSMLRSTLHTDVAEARELFGWALLPHLALYAALPLALLARVRIVVRPWRRAVAVRAAWLLGALACAIVTLVTVYQPLASLMRNHKEARYLITPANVLWSVASVAAADARGAARPRAPIGVDAAPGPSWRSQRRPRVLVLVIGETARAENWGLSGYARQTTPQLARLPLVSFADVTSCGTDTETSVPCMFAPVGRRDYDAARIRGSESLLHVAARAGVQVHWRDNQTGCKGVCDGLPNDHVAALNPPGLCAQGRCLDEALLYDIDQRLAAARGTQLWVLHMLGNHGPSYFRRYPPAFARHQPACASDELQNCTREEIVNAYDNALLYTDHVLATLVAKLRAHAPQVDAAMLYVSDHGESLGEHGLFLHGVPYAIAPPQQTKVPMLLWTSDGFARAAGLDTACLSRRAAQPASHDHLFHTVLGLLDVRTALHEPAWDLAAGCRDDAS